VLEQVVQDAASAAKASAIQPGSARGAAAVGPRRLKLA
jgi:hypothetical protein